MSSHKENIKISNSDTYISEDIVEDTSKCYHDGDYSCTSNEVIKETVKKIPEDVTNSSASLNDSLHSGESIFKTFVFDTLNPDPDMEKCIAFWETILTKNVKPVKCTFTSPKKRKKKIPKKEEKPNDNENIKAMFCEIYKDLQKRHLEEVKLVKKKTCDPCPELSDDEYEKKRDVEDIKNLNNWKAESTTRPLKLDIKTQVKRTLAALKQVRSEQQSEIETAAPAGTPASSERITTPKGSPQTSRLSSRRCSSVSQKLIDSPVTSQIVTSFCDRCGCEIENCVCKSGEDCLRKNLARRSTLEKVEGNLCEDEVCRQMCLEECVCPEEEEEKVGCCGCGVEECTCESLEVCRCGCGLEGCICRNIEGQCSCGCGLEECICKTLFKNSCQCGHEDCECGMMEVLSSYLESLEEPRVSMRMQNEDLMISTETQTDDGKVFLETTEKEGSYCVICGHFNCYCRIEKTND